MNKGFVLIEIMLSIALAAIILPALVFVFSLSLQSAKQGEKYSKAYALAQEQMEAIYSIKKNGGADWDWNETPPITTGSEYYQPYLVSGQWQIGSKTASPSEIDGYVKKVKVFEVKRDTSGNLSDEAWATPDDNSRMVTVIISWTDSKGDPEEVKLDSLLTNY